MANPSKQKGTGGETELLRLLQATFGPFRNAVRTPPASPYDIQRPGENSGRPLNILATRPDHGRWLVTMDLDAFIYLAEAADSNESEYHDDFPEYRIEVKRYARLAFHSIFEKKFGKR